MTSLRALIVSLAAWTLCAAAQAQPAPEGGGAAPETEAASSGGEAPSPENMRATREAREHFMAGIEHFRQHQYREAIRRFQLAAELVPSADLWFNIARAHEELSEYEDAIDYYGRYLRDRVDPPDRSAVEARIEELRQRAEAQRASQREAPTHGELRLTANRDGAAVLLDGAPAGTSPWPSVREVTPGRHALALDQPGYIPFRAEVSIEAGVTTAAYADLVPETRYRAIRSAPVFAWVAWGLGAGALGAAVGLGVEAASRQGSDLDSARTFAAYSDGMLGAAVGMAVLGLVLWFVEGRTVATEQVTLGGSDAAGVRAPE